MDIVLGVSMAPASVQMVLVEGENADGPFVARLPREPGRRDSRYAQLLTGEVDLNVTAADSPVWTGLQSSEWSTNNIAGSKNWKLISAGTPTEFYNNDLVLFSDAAGANFGKAAGNLPGVIIASQRGYTQLPQRKHCFDTLAGPRPILFDP